LVVAVVVVGRRAAAETDPQLDHGLLDDRELLCLGQILVRGVPGRFRLGIDDTRDPLGPGRLLREKEAGRGGGA
jgi:hypothetical protein